MRHLVLAALGPLLLLVVPMALVALIGERLPEQVTVQGWAFATQIDLTWREWSAQPVFGVMVWAEALLIVAFQSYWHVPSGDRAPEGRYKLDDGSWDGVWSTARGRCWRCGWPMVAGWSIRRRRRTPGPR
ncbi:hypothetical protein [Nonomuraea gerenzanensis]|uniref:Uncharacterized protein n=1 Tax=Nonomuraea gerenzanensis TaxID=93944 RepID=A0A1M4DVQ5_9ACTN|nr:hypothetical protein [Nonomuraea gerenzanensis]UBU12996.1 hypothetical protein LCN96_53630 [Nonomuraea gerenzanensis]SBO90635.1 hypothetical protein BN4615_P149 [Nonomuraea gerenzanensis]